MFELLFLNAIFDADFVDHLAVHETISQLIGQRLGDEVATGATLAGNGYYCHVFVLRYSLMMIYISWITLRTRRTSFSPATFAISSTSSWLSGC